jgi:DNA topoisomerase-3
MKLYIAEKPSLARTIAEVLGATIKKSGYIEGDDMIITWCYGHMYEQFMPDDYDQRYQKWNIDDLPIIPDQFKLKPREDALDQIELINSFIDEIEADDVLINCGDPDREGQLIVDEVIEKSGFEGPVLRAWMQDLSVKGLTKALSNLVNNEKYKHYRLSAETRTQADWVAGLNLTRAYTCQARKYGHQGVITIGRVQTPTLNMVVERDEQIENFKIREFYEHEITLKKEGVSFIATQVCEKQFDKEKAQEDMPGDVAVVESYCAKIKRKNPPLPFTLSALQTEANKRFGLTAKEVMEVAQKLYEVHKVTSYPRTDCPYLNEATYEEQAELIAELLVEYGVNEQIIETIPKCFNDKKVGAHTGIIPVSNTSADLSETEQRVFDLIKQRFVCQFLKPMKFNEVVVELSSNNLVFKASGKQLVDEGYTQLDENSRTKNTLLPPELKDGEKLDVVSAELITKKTTPPKRFTEGQLIAAMENVARVIEDGENKNMLKEIGGIGTNATRDGIIDNLKERGFLEVNKKIITSAPKSRKLMSLLSEDIKSPLLTAKWESKIKQIEQGSLTQEDYMEELAQWVNKACNAANKADLSVIGGKKCPSCHEGYIVTRQGKNGPFQGCTKYPECTYIVPNVNSRKKRRRRTRRAS